MTTIYVKTVDQILSGVILPKLATGNKNTVRLHVDFDTAWDGYSGRSAIFYTDKNPTPYKKPLSSDGICDVPPECLVEDAHLFVAVEGVSASGAVKSSTRMQFKIVPGSPVVVLSDPTADVYHQLLGLYGNTETALAVERARINNIISGAAAGDTEVTDIRVDADGKTHSTAGAAVRSIGNKIKGIMQNGGEENPLRPLMFNRVLSYKGGTSYKYNDLDIPINTVGDLAHYNSVEQTDGTNYVIGGKLVSPIPVSSETSGKYFLVVDSDENFSAYIIISSQGNWGASAVRMHSESFNVKKGYNIIPLTLNDATNEGVTADNYEYVMLRSYSPFTVNFTAHIIHGGGVLGWMLDKHPNAEKYITCWGDSLTAQAGWTETLAELSGLTVYNAGTGGESARTIMARQGADTMMVDNLTIPASTTAVQIASKATDGGIATEFGYNATPLLQGGTAHVNPVMIGDIEGTLKWTGSSYSDNSGTWTFTRSVVGVETKIDRPTAIRTAYDREKNAPYLMVIFMGQNGGYNSDNAELVRMHRLMISHAKAENVVVLGLSSGTAESRAEYETAMREEFGRNFISLREYLSKYGLADAGLTATADDTAAMEIGQVPPQLLRDTVHYTDACRTVIGKMLYRKCRDLNIFW